MRKNTGMAYKRRCRNAKVRKEQAEMIRCYEECRGDMPFDEFIKAYPFFEKRLKKPGRYAKKGFYAAKSSRKQYAYYSNKEIRNAYSALSAYDEYGLSNEVVNRSEARKVKHTYT